MSAYRLLPGALAWFVLAVSNPCYAHELRPGYLEVNETAPNVYDVIWKVPSIGGRPLPVEPRFPSSCELQSAVGRQLSGRSVVSQVSFSCKSSLHGQRIEFSGLDSTLTDVLVRLGTVEGELQALRATPSTPFVNVAEAGTAQSVARTYFVLGVEHILLGVDHLLFVFALVLIIPNVRRLVITITSFTLAHSVTLIAASLHVVSLPTRPVEAVIALSIVFLAHEIASKKAGTLRQTERWPWLVAFVFGLLHGFGFAGALTEIGLPENEVPVGLLTFNLGVEVGQLAFLAAVLVLLAVVKKVGVRKKFDTVASYAIGITASFWLIERLV